jgi:hypothetical protein
MRNSFVSKIVLFLGVFSAAISASAWNHGVSIGFGGGEDINHSGSYNQGGLLSASFVSMAEKNWLKLTLDGSVGQFHSFTPANKYLTTAAVSAAFRLYPYQSALMHPYFLVSVGPGYISQRRFGLNNQGAYFAFQSILGLGTEIGYTKRVDLNLKLVHYSNAFLFTPNEGYNIMYVGSIGYLF